jgi:hypothetical protein
MVYKIFIFDLDLTLWDGRCLYPDVYGILTFLKSINKMLYVVSYHSHAKMCCEYLQIQDFFNNILYDRNVEKNVMVKNILREHQNIKEEEIVFYDDQLINILDVYKNNKILSILIEEGLKWEHILKLKCKKFINENNKKIKVLFEKTEEALKHQNKMMNIYKNIFNDDEQKLIYRDLKLNII